MLLGEYAVLYNKPAVVLAIDKRITVTLVPRTDGELYIDSPGYASWSGSLTDLTITPPFNFVTACVIELRGYLRSGCEIYITSEFSAQFGLGSSAAVTAATLGALVAWCQLDYSRTQLIKIARKIIRLVQGGVGSGADIAASVMGGIIYYTSHPLKVERCSGINALPLTVVYSGTKAATPNAIKMVQDYFADNRDILRALLHTIKLCAVNGYNALKQENYVLFGKLMNVQQGLLESLGVSTPALTNLLAQLRSCPDVLGAKISGAGFGDCVIGLGVVPELELPKLLVNMTNVGLEYLHE